MKWILTLGILFFGMSVFIPNPGTAANSCSIYTKQILCVSYPGCCWQHQRCTRCNAAEDRFKDVVNATSLDLKSISFDGNSIDETGKYLGCTVDAHQCGMRATRYGYAHHYAKRSYLCPNGATFGCWGR